MSWLCLESRRRSEQYPARITRSHEVRFNGMLLCYGLYTKTGLWHACDSQWLALGVWGRCVLYVCQMHITCMQKLCIICMSKHICMPVRV